MVKWLKFTVMHELIKFPLFPKKVKVLCDGEKVFSTREGWIYINPSQIVSVEPIGVQILSHQPFITKTELSDIEPSSEKYAHFQKLIDRDDSIEYDGSYHSVIDVFHSIKVCLSNANEIISPMSWKRFHDFWVSVESCNYKVINESDYSKYSDYYGDF